MYNETNDYVGLQETEVTNTFEVRSNNLGLIGHIIKHEKPDCFVFVPLPTIYFKGFYLKMILLHLEKLNR